MNRFEKSAALGFMSAAMLAGGCGGHEKYDANCNPNLTYRTYMGGLLSRSPFLANVLIPKEEGSVIEVKDHDGQKISNPLVICWRGVKAYIGRSGVDRLEVVGIHSNDIAVIHNSGELQTVGKISDVASVGERVVYAKTNGDIFTEGFNDTQSQTIYGLTS